MMCPELETCDTSVTICTRPLGSTGISCDEPGQQLLVATRFSSNTNSFNFASDFFDFFGFPNPGPVLGTGAWRVSAVNTCVSVNSTLCYLVLLYEAFFWRG